MPDSPNDEFTRDHLAQKKPFTWPTASWGSLLLWAVLLLTGFVVGVVVNNSLLGEGRRLTTDGLVSFVFTVALGGASFVLAILAILLGDRADKTLSERSEAGIRLQDEIFRRTIDVLGTIKTSTDITKTRLEDLISGRTKAAIGDAIEQALPQDPVLPKEQRDTLKDDIISAIRRELRQAEQWPSGRPGEKRSKSSHMPLKSLRSYIASFEGYIESRPGVRIFKRFGTPDGHSFQSWEIVAEINGRVCAFDIRDSRETDAGAMEIWLKSANSLTQWAVKTIDQIEKDGVDRVFLVARSGWGELVRALNGALAKAKPGDPRFVVKYIQSQSGDDAGRLVFQNLQQPPPPPHAG